MFKQNETTTKRCISKDGVQTHRERFNIFNGLLENKTHRVMIETTEKNECDFVIYTVECSSIRKEGSNKFTIGTIQTTKSIRTRNFNRHVQRNGEYIYINKKKNSDQGNEYKK